MAKVPVAAVLYPLAGAAAGAVVGLVVTSPARAFEAAAPWLVGVATVVGVGGGAYFGLAALARVRRARRRDVPVDAVAIPALPVALDLPGIGAGFPDVWGAGETIEVLVRAPADAAATLRSEPPLALDERGPGRWAFRAPEGEVVLVASAKRGDSVGESRRAVTFVRYGREIQNMVDDFRAWAEANVEGAKSALTARELVQAVAPHAGADGERALLTLARAYEIVTYGERPADRALYVEVVRAFAALERSGLFERVRAVGAEA